MSASQLIADRFEISDPEKDLLGRGSMGDVYRATDTQTGEPVAVKALSPDVVARDLEATVNEAQVANQFFTETSLPTFPYRLRGSMRK